MAKCAEAKTRIFNFRHRYKNITIAVARAYHINSGESDWLIFLNKFNTN
jgi:hypothetical protein